MEIAYLYLAHFVYNYHYHHSSRLFLRLDLVSSTFLSRAPHLKSHMLSWGTSELGLQLDWAGVCPSLDYLEHQKLAPKSITMGKLLGPEPLRVMLEYCPLLNGPNCHSVCNAD